MLAVCETKWAMVTSWRKWIVLSTWGRKGQRMVDVKLMWYTMIEWFEAWGTLKSVLINIILHGDKCEEVSIVPTMLYGAEACIRTAE